MQTLRILAILVILINICVLVTSYSIEIESGEKLCYIVQAAVGVSITGSFEVITGDPKMIVVALTGPDKYIHYTSKYDGKGEDKDFSEGSFSLEAKLNGDYTFCIQNGEEGRSDGVTKTIAFNVRATDANQQDYEYSGLQSELLALKEGLDFLKDHQSYMNQREDVHKESLESINTKILCWTILEAVILLAMSIWQITYIRSFFETKRRV
jgi:p24 family protein beta-1